MTVTIEIDGKEWSYEGGFPCAVVEATMKSAGLLEEDEVLMILTEEQASAID